MHIALDFPVTLRCLRCRWVFTTSPKVMSPSCTNCGSDAQLHEVCAQDFQDPARYAQFGPGLGGLPPNFRPPSLHDSHSR